MKRATDISGALGRGIVLFLLLLLATLWVGCGYPSYMSFEQRDQTDARIPDWEIEIWITEQTQRNSTDSVVTYSFTFVARPRKGPRAEWLGVDSLVIYRPNGEGEFTDIFYQSSFDNWAPTHHANSKIDEIRAPLPIPDSLSATVFYKILNPREEESRELMLEYKLPRTKVKSWESWLAGP